jgi:hypothetical protein
MKACILYSVVALESRSSNREMNRMYKSSNSLRHMKVIIDLSKFKSTYIQIYTNLRHPFRDGGSNLLSVTQISYV